jgi:hypothetical protein
MESTSSCGVVVAVLVMVLVADDVGVVDWLVV